MPHPHRLPTRIGALALALLASFAAPSAALAHGVAHGHLLTAHHAPTAVASEHEHDAPDRHAVRTGDDRDEVHHAPPPAHEHDGVHAASPASSPQLAPAGHSHRHGHPPVDRAAAPRDAWRLAVFAPDFPLPTGSVLPDLAVVEHAPAVPERACLARPAPESGAPPTLRAPPLQS